MSHSNDTQKFQTGKVALIALSHLVHDIYSSFLAPILPLLIDKLGFSYTLAGLLTVAQRSPSVLNPILGIIADKISVRYFLIGAPAITAISMSLLGAAPSYPVLVILLLIMGLSAACYHVPAPVMIKQISGDQIGKGMSFFMFAGELARMIGPLVIIGAVWLWGLEGTYCLIAPGLLASLLLYLNFKNIPVQRQASAARPAGLGQTLIKMRKTFIGLTGILIFMGGLKGAMVVFLPVYLTEKGSSLALAGISLSVLQAGGVVGALAAGTLSDRLGRKFVLLATTLAAPVVTWIFLLNPAFLTAPILFILGFFLLSNGPVMLAIIQESDTERPAYVNGVYMMINFLAGSGMTVLAGASNDWLGLDKTCWLATFLFFGAILCLPLLPGKSRG
ncbi:MFS transporter [Candidatus Sumerlaeota bacterium]|nr:MFS transporter [Candidatus Sumerlaeota bacterium]